MLLIKERSFDVFNKNQWSKFLLVTILGLALIRPLYQCCPEPLITLIECDLLNKVWLSVWGTQGGEINPTLLKCICCLIIKTQWQKDRRSLDTKRSGQKDFLSLSFIDLSKKKWKHTSSGVWGGFGGCGLLLDDLRLCDKRWFTHPDQRNSHTSFFQMFLWGWELPEVAREPVNQQFFKDQNHHCLLPHRQTHNALWQSSSYTLVSHNNFQEFQLF